MIKFFVIIVLLLNTQSLLAGGGGSGAHGGSAVVCRDELRNVKIATLLDVFEAKRRLKIPEQSSYDLKKLENQSGDMIIETEKRTKNILGKYYTQIVDLHHCFQFPFLSNYSMNNQLITTRLKL